jgi:two-component system, LytTR family, response regulator AlgR
MRILIVDDEHLARARLSRLLAELRPDDELVEATSGEQAMQLAEEEIPDLALLDIRMPGIDGIEVAEQLGLLQQPPAIIFCTAYDQYALQALERHAVAYLLKPVRGEELARALDAASKVNRLQLAALREPDSARREVSSQGHRGLQTMAIDEVRCFIAGDKYVTACGCGSELVLQDTLKELEQEFPDVFVRVHRNALVSVGHIVKLRREGSGAWQVELQGADQQPVISRRHLAEVKQRLLDR